MQKHVLYVLMALGMPSAQQVPNATLLGDDLKEASRITNDQCQGQFFKIVETDHGPVLVIFGTAVRLGEESRYAAASGRGIVFLKENPRTGIKTILARLPPGILCHFFKLVPGDADHKSAVVMFGVTVKQGDESLYSVMPGRIMSFGTVNSRTGKVVPLARRGDFVLCPSQ